MSNMSLRNKLKSNNGGPPTVDQISRKGLFAELSKREMPSEVVDFRTQDGNIYKLRICVLRYEDHESCRVMAYNDLKEKYKEAEIPNSVLQDSVALFILFKAIKEVEPTELPDGTKIYHHAFETVDQIRKVLTGDEVFQLFNLYELTQDKLNPNESTIWINDNFDKWINALAEGSVDFLAALPLPFIANTMIEMARVLITNGHLNKLQSIMELNHMKSNSDIFSSSEPAVNHSGENKEVKLLTHEEAMEKIKKAKGMK